MDRSGDVRNVYNILLAGIQRMGAVWRQRFCMAGMKREVKDKDFNLLSGFSWLSIKWNDGHFKYSKLICFFVFYEAYGGEELEIRSLLISTLHENVQSASQLNRFNLG